MALIGHLELPSNTRGIGVGEEIVVMTRAEHEELRAEVERLRAQQPDAELVAHFDAPKESTPAQLAQERDLWRRHHENMRTITAALTEALDGEVAGWAGRPELYLAYQAACDATGRTAEPAPAHIAPEESETPAPGTPECMGEGMVRVCPASHLDAAQSEAARLRRALEWLAREAERHTGECPFSLESYDDNPDSECAVVARGEECRDTDEWWRCWYEAALAAAEEATP